MFAQTLFLDTGSDTPFHHKVYIYVDPDIRVWEEQITITFVRANNCSTENSIASLVYGACLSGVPDPTSTSTLDSGARYTVFVAVLPT